MIRPTPAAEAFRDDAEERDAEDDADDRSQHRIGEHEPEAGAGLPEQVGPQARGRAGPMLDAESRPAVPEARNVTASKNSVACGAWEPAVPPTK